MNAVFVLGRVLLVVLFIISGLTKLLDLTGTAATLEKIVIPAPVDQTVAQVATALGLTVPKLLAIFVGVVELLGGVLIAVGVLTRTVAVILLIYTVAATFYFHDFWNMTGEARVNNMTHALKNLSIIGALFILASLPRRLWVVERDTYYPDERHAVVHERQVVHEMPPRDPAMPGPER